MKLISKGMSAAQEVEDCFQKNIEAYSTICDVCCMPHLQDKEILNRCKVPSEASEILVKNRESVYHYDILSDVLSRLIAQDEVCQEQWDQLESFLEDDAKHALHIIEDNLRKLSEG